MNKFILKEVTIICKTCQKPGIIPLKNSKAEKEFNENKKGLNCLACAFKFWEPKIKSGETVLQEESKDFQEAYWAEKTKQNNHE